MPAKKQDAEISIAPLSLGSVRLRIIGTSPLYQNRMSEKVRQGLLVGSKKKTAAEKASIKHHPEDEFRSSAETVQDGPTALGVVTTAVKAAMSSAALETAGVTKASTQRLIRVPAGHFPLYGTPKLKIDITRSADMNRTPDMRTRCYLPKWGAEVSVSFITPQLSITSIITLLANAGFIIGIGDFRQEKGKGSYGAFRVIGEGDEDPEWDDLTKNHGRMRQMAALASPEPADQGSEELLEFYHAECARRSA